MSLAKQRVVVLIISYQEQLSDYEKISLKQCLTVLKNYPIRIVKPGSISHSSWNIDHSRVKTEDFPDRYFNDIGAYSRMLLSKSFYRRFEEFEYMLIYQLDAFIFRDDLLEWCDKGFDYIGAPWFEKFSSSDTNAPFVAGGNGGFSLRNIGSHLRVLNSFSFIEPPASNWHKRMAHKLPFKEYLRQACGFLLDLTIRNNTYWMLNSFRGFEDQFWCLVAARNFSWFKIPHYKEAMNFAFEMQPRRVFDINDHRLPFGCHAWWKYDLAFWKPFIESYGFELKPGN
jgi:hypothetical protein